MTEENVKPQIRFKGFSEAWEQRKLGEVVNVYDGVHQTPDYKDSGIMFLSVENIATLKSEKYISEEVFQRDYKVYPQKGDLLMTRIGDVGTPNVVETNEKMAFYVSLALLKPKEIDSYFLCDSIQSPLFQKGLKNRTLITAIPQKINKDEIGKIDIVLPISIDEQRQIGAYFKQLDNLITLHQHKYNKLHNIKKSMSEKMFPKNDSNIPEIRFKGFTEAWEQQKLRKLCSLITKGTTPLDKSNKGTISFVKIESIDDLSGEITITQKISEEEHNGYLHRSQLKEKDILFSIAGTLGRVTSVKSSILPANTNQALAIIRLKSASLQYVETYLKGKIVSEFIKKNPTIGAQPNLSLEQVENLEIVLPSELEQQKIGQYFETLDHLLTLHQRKLQKLKNIKQSMLEKMFV